MLENFTLFFYLLFIALNIVSRYIQPLSYETTVLTSHSARWRCYGKVSRDRSGVPAWSVRWRLICRSQCDLMSLADVLASQSFGMHGFKVVIYIRMLLTWVWFGSSASAFHDIFDLRSSIVVTVRYNLSVCGIGRDRTGHLALRDTTTSSSDSQLVSDTNTYVSH